MKRPVNSQGRKKAAYDRNGAAVADFATSFKENVVAKQACMSGLCLAVFADEAKIVRSDEVLAGGPDFIRCFFPSSLYTVAVLHAIKGEGAVDLALMMSLLNIADPTAKDAKRLQNAMPRLTSRALAFHNWMVAQGASSVRH